MITMPEKTKITKQQRASIYYKGGMSLASIAGRMHVSPITIRNWLLKEGVTMRGRGRPVKK